MNIQVDPSRRMQRAMKRKGFIVKFYIPIGSLKQGSKRSVQRHGNVKGRMLIDCDFDQDSGDGNI